MKIRITLNNGDYPLSCDCSTISEAFSCIETLRRGHLHDVPFEMDEIMTILVKMKHGEQLTSKTHLYAISRIEEKESPREGD